MFRAVRAGGWLLFLVNPSLATAQSARVEPPPNALLRPHAFPHKLATSGPGVFLNHVRDEMKVPLDIDLATVEALQKHGSDWDVRLQWLSLPLGVHLEHIANQVGATVTWKNGQVTLAPGRPQSFARFLSRPSDETQKFLKQDVRFERAIENTPLRDVCEFLTDKYDMQALIDDALFRTATGKGASTVQVRLPAGEKPLTGWLEDLARACGSRVQIFEEAVLIVPISKEES